MTVTVPQPLRAPQPPRRIAVFRALHLGDLLCATPALRALRAAAPGAHIALVGLPWARGFVERYGGYVDEWIEYPPGEALPDPVAPASASAQAFAQQMRERRFDLAVQLHGNGGRSNAVVAGFGAIATAGFHPADTVAPGPLYLPWRSEEPEVRRWLRLIAYLGARGPLDETLDFPVAPAECESARRLLKAGSIDGPYVCLHAGARLRSRRWPLRRYALIARALRADGWSVVLTGSGSERDIAAAIGKLCSEPPWAPRRAPLLDLTGRTDLGTLGAVIGKAAVLLCNDTGVSHIAAALGTPSVVVSCGGDARRWAPARRERHRVLAAPAPCRPCTYDDCPNGHVCAEAIGVDAVLAALYPFLHDRSAHAA